MISLEDLTEKVQREAVGSHTASAARINEICKKHIPYKLAKTSFRLTKTDFLHLFRISGSSVDGSGLLTRIMHAQVEVYEETDISRSSFSSNGDVRI